MGYGIQSTDKISFLNYSHILHRTERTVGAGTACALSSSSMLLNHPCRRFTPAREQGTVHAWDGSDRTEFGILESGSQHVRASGCYSGYSQRGSFEKTCHCYECCIHRVMCSTSALISITGVP
jgi:hypothetical protein